MTNKIIDAVALTLGIVGALNWGLIGLFKFDLVATLFGNMSILSRIVYALVGFAGIYLISFFMYISNDNDQKIQQVHIKRLESRIQNFRTILMQ